MRYRYTAEDDRVYPDILVPGEGSLVARPGDEREFEVPPGDGRWEPAIDPVKPAKASKE